MIYRIFSFRFESHDQLDCPLKFCIVWTVVPSITVLLRRPTGFSMKTYLIVYSTSISYWSLGSLWQFCIGCPVGLILNIINRWSTYNCFTSAYTVDFLCQFCIRWSVGLSMSLLCNFNCWICCLFCLKSSVRLSILVLYQMTRMSALPKNTL